MVGVVARSGMIPCPHCGALNGAAFDRCIRCNQSLDPSAPVRPAPSRPPPRGASGPPVQPRRSYTPSQLKFFGISAESLPATKFFIALTTLVFGGQVISAISRGKFDALVFGSNPIDDLRFGALFLWREDPVFNSLTVLQTEPWRLLTANFVHFGIIHFVLNMAALVWLARLAEPAVGSARFAMAYVISGIAGFGATAAYAMFSPDLIRTAGSSSAIFGVMGLIVGYLYRRQDPRWKAFAMQAVMFSLLFGVAIGANNSAHLGGLVVGIGFGALFAPGAPKPARTWQVALGVLCMIACIVTLILAQRSELWQILERMQNAA